MLTRAEVVAAYRAVLGRDPESEQAIERRSDAADLADLGRSLIDTDEFAAVLAARRPDRRRDLDADLESATRRAEAAELRCADLAAQLLHQGPPASAATPRAAAPPGADELRAQLAAMRASTSWRLTAPLRAVVSRVRG